LFYNLDKILLYCVATLEIRFEHIDLSQRWYNARRALSLSVHRTERRDDVCTNDINLPEIFDKNSVSNSIVDKYYLL